MKPKILNCGESGTTLSLSVLPVAEGFCGDGIFVFTGEGKLPQRSRRAIIDEVNKNAAIAILNGKQPKSFAISANKEYHLPLTVWVGGEAISLLVKEINDGKYSYFKHSLSFQE